MADGTAAQTQETGEFDALTETDRPDADGDGLVLEDLIVEDVSIDGMCGVY